MQSSRIAQRYCAVVLSLCSVLATHRAHAQSSRLAIDREILTLAGLTADQKEPDIRRIAKSINEFPSHIVKLQLALGLLNASDYGSVNRSGVQFAADNLALALAQAPQPADGNDGSAIPFYTSLASVIRYEHLRMPSDPRLEPMLSQAERMLEANDAAVRRADFTLKDLGGKEWTLSKLKGHVVLVDFWATWCAPCVAELPDLDSLYRSYAARGLVVLALTNEDAAVLRSFVTRQHLASPVLLDSHREAMRQFHVGPIPRNFLFDKRGMLLEQFSVRSKAQIVDFLSEAGLKP